MILPSIMCIAAAAWFEARGEGADGMAAVADSIMVRAARRNLSPCEVTHEPGQYVTGTVNIEYLQEADLVAWDQARGVAINAWFGHGLGLEADYFHTTSVHPSWANDFAVVGRIGNHIFYNSEE